MCHPLDSQHYRWLWPRRAPCFDWPRSLLPQHLLGILWNPPGTLTLALGHCRDFLAGPSWPQGARTCPPWPAWAAAFARVGQGGRFSPKPGPQIIFFERAKAQTALRPGRQQTPHGGASKTHSTSRSRRSRRCSSRRPTTCDLGKLQVTAGQFGGSIPRTTKQMSERQPHMPRRGGMSQRFRFNRIELKTPGTSFTACRSVFLLNFYYGSACSHC